MTTAHKSWAAVYDAIYESSFGASYAALTETTLACVRELVALPASIVDFGAGTGRLAVPLAVAGYRVTAVDPCLPMLLQLQAKAADANVQVDVRCQGMEVALPTAGFDLGLCVFTVTAYLLDEAALTAACANAAAVLRPGGRLLIDVPGRELFSDFARSVPGGERRVTVEPHPERPDLHTYEEHTTIVVDGHAEEIRDRFEIRHWAPSAVSNALKDAGLSQLEDLSGRFRGTGSRYFLYQKVA